MKRFIYVLLVLFCASCKNENQPVIIKPDTTTKFIFINNDNNIIINKMNFNVRIFFPKENFTEFVNNWGYSIENKDSVSIKIDHKLYKDCIYQYMLNWEEKNNFGEVVYHLYSSYSDTLKTNPNDNFVINWPKDSIKFEKIH